MCSDKVQVLKSPFLSQAFVPAQNSKQGLVIFLAGLGYCGLAENLALEWMSTVAVCENSGKKRVIHAIMSLFLRLLRYGMLNLP